MEQLASMPFGCLSHITTSFHILHTNNSLDDFRNDAEYPIQPAPEPAPGGQILGPHEAETLDEFIDTVGEADPEKDRFWSKDWSNIEADFETWGAVPPIYCGVGTNVPLPSPRQTGFPANSLSFSNIESTEPRSSLSEFHPSNISPNTDSAPDDYSQALTSALNSSSRTHIHPSFDNGRHLPLENGLFLFGGAAHYSDRRTPHDLHIPQVGLEKSGYYLQNGYRDSYEMLKDDKDCSRLGFGSDTNFNGNVFNSSGIDREKHDMGSVLDCLSVGDTLDRSPMFKAAEVQAAPAGGTIAAEDEDVLKGKRRSLSKEEQRDCLYVERPAKRLKKPGHSKVSRSIYPKEDPPSSKDSRGRASNRARKRENLSEEMKRKNHTKSEQKRRDSIKSSYDHVVELVPGMHACGQSKAVSIAHAVQWLEEILRQNKQMEEYLQRIN